MLSLARYFAHHCVLLEPYMKALSAPAQDTRRPEAQDTNAAAELRIEGPMNHRGGQIDRGAEPYDTFIMPETSSRRTLYSEHAVQQAQMVGAVTHFPLCPLTQPIQYHVGPPFVSNPNLHTSTYAASQPSFNRHLDSGIRFLGQGSGQIVDLPPIYTEE